MYLVHNTDFVVARRPAAALVTMTCLAQAMQHVCSRLVGVKLCWRLGQPAGAAHLHRHSSMQLKWRFEEGELPIEYIMTVFVEPGFDWAL